MAIKKNIVVLKESKSSAMVIIEGKSLIHLRTIIKSFILSTTKPDNNRGHPHVEIGQICPLE